MLKTWFAKVLTINMEILKNKKNKKILILYHIKLISVFLEMVSMRQLREIFLKLSFVVVVFFYFSVVELSDYFSSKLFYF